MRSIIFLMICLVIWMIQISESKGNWFFSAETAIEEVRGEFAPITTSIPGYFC